MKPEPESHPEKTPVKGMHFERAEDVSEGSKGMTFTGEVPR